MKALLLSALLGLSGCAPLLELAATYDSEGANSELQRQADMSRLEFQNRQIQNQLRNQELNPQSGW